MTTRPDRGATTIEFALVLLLLLTFLLAIVDFGRLLFTWGAASEATRAGARYAVVCDDTGSSAAVLARMKAMLPAITAVSVGWSPPGCNSTSCEGVTVAISGLQFRWISPLAGLPLPPPMPVQGFSTYLPREAMRQDPNSSAICS